METLYNWLLHNTGNEGNHLTILNVHRQTDDDDASIAQFAVMARTGDFEIVNLLIHPISETNLPAAETDELTGRTVKQTYYFADEDQVIAYLAEGQTNDATANSSGISVLVFEPGDNSDGLTFPPE